MRLRHAATTAALTLTALAAGLPAAASADDPPPAPSFAPLYPVSIKPMALREDNRTRKQAIPVTCNFDVCDYWVGPRDGSAKGARGDFNPFRVLQYELHRGESRDIAGTVQALRDDVWELNETFSLAVVQDGQDAGGPWLHREDRATITIRNTTPRPAISPAKAKAPAPCYSCTD
jgi:hypothetical protein